MKQETGEGVFINMLNTHVYVYLPWFSVLKGKISKIVEI